MKNSRTKADPAIVALLMLLDEAYNKPAWYGPNLRGSLRRLSAAQAAWRPAPERKNIWELAVHAAYWKYTVLRQLTGQKRGSFPLVGSNWFARPEVAGTLRVPSPGNGTRSVPATEEAWRGDLKLLDRIHADLRAAVETLAPDKLDAKPPASKHTYRRLIQGAALHDVYHAGQIQTLKRLMGGTANASGDSNERPLRPPFS